MAHIFSEHNVTIMLNEHDGNPFAVAEFINKQYSRGLITQEETFDMLDALTKYF